MIRPVMMNSNITFGFRKNKKDIKTETATQKTQPPKPPVTTDSFSSESEEKKVHKAFLLGAIFGTIVGGAGITAYDNYETNNIMKDMMEEVSYGTDGIFIEDMTKDSTPELILRGTDGFSTVYDLKNNKVYIDTGDELIEKE